MIKKSVLSEVIQQQKSKIQQGEFGQKRTLLVEIHDKPDDFALIISGIRRCGKSTFLFQYITEQIKEDYLYLNFESTKLYSFDIRDFQLLDELISEFGIKWLVFDEIQIISGWEIYVRQKLDEEFKVIITGSNASLLSRELGTKLTGRHLTKELFPFSFMEFYSFKNLEPTADSFAKFMELGGFPGYLNSNNPDIHAALLDDILFRDIAVRHNIRDIKSLKRLLMFIAANTSNLISATKLKQYLGVKSTATIQEYLGYFEESYLLQLIPKFSYSQKVQLVNPRKIYFIDNGLQDALTLTFTQDYGRKLENAVFWELRRTNRWLYYFNENGKECDFVVCLGDKVEKLIQVCYFLNTENEERELNGLVDAMNYFNFEEGTIITMNQKDVIRIEGKNINVIPAFEYFSN